MPPTGPWGDTPQGKPAPEGWAPVPGMPPAPPIPAEEREGLLMLRAMIAAAKADGHVDSSERERIAGQLDAAGLGAAARDAVLAEFDRSVTPEDLAREARDPMLAAQVYAAAVAGAAAIEGSERAWLDGFARALRLDGAATEAIERRIRGG
ncbi:tellurite resistance TerB family protein [Roseomonas soli]|uniref:Tellurite resistance TerB family protein n=1 Tax=Neoroseomonas soli TaxID=1081025 RepID=A0A9X9X4T5_9PROT|nr:tellurite resistance TerB family protein [Neoroseomonas soli]